MKRRPRIEEKRAISQKTPIVPEEGEIGIVLSGGGARAAYQVGALKALQRYLENEEHPITAIVGSSIGAINGLILAACLRDGITEAVLHLESVWRERTFRNTFAGSPSLAFLRAIRTAVLQYLSPGPHASDDSIFDPTPLMQRVDQVIREKGGLHPDDRCPQLRSVAVMTTVEGEERKPLLFLSSHSKLDAEVMTGASFNICYVDTMTAKHGFASAALPTVLPPVELDTEEGQVRLVDGGISQNVPIDPAVRFGAERIITIDISGRSWWLDHFGEPHDTRPTWEVPAGFDTFCMRPTYSFYMRNQKPLGHILKEAVNSSTKKFMQAVGPTWPIYTLLKNKLGEEVAFETMSYVALDPDYLHGLIERGYNETLHRLRSHGEPEFTREKPEELIAKALEGDGE